jgi:hypothetical protein
MGTIFFGFIFVAVVGGCSAGKAIRSGAVYPKTDMCREVRHYSFAVE